MADLGSITWRVEVDTSDLKVADREMDAARKSADDFGKSAEKAGNKTTTAGKKAKTATGEMKKGFTGATTAVKGLAAALIAVGLVKGLRDTISATNEFNKSVSELSAITGAVGADLEFFAEQSKEIGRTTSLSASQAVTAFKLIASAKPELLESAAALNAVTREAVTLAEAAGIDLTAAAKAVAGSLNQFGKGAEDANRFINVLAAGSKFGSSAIDETTAALDKSGAAASAMGLSFEETNAAIQVLAKGEIRASEAGTGLRNVLLALEQETDENLRPSVVGVSTAIENLAAKGLDAVEMMDLFGKENFVAGQILVDNAGLIDELEQAMTGTSIATEQAATNLDNLSGDALNAGSAIEGFQISLGNKLTPALRDVTQGFTKFANGVTTFIESDSFERWMGRVGLAIKALALIITTRLVLSLAAAATGFAATATAAGLAATATGVLRAALVFIGGPIGAFVLAIGAVVAVIGALVKAYKSWKGAQEEAISGRVAAAVTEGLDSIGSHITGVENNIKNLNVEYEELEHLSSNNVFAMRRQRVITKELGVEQEVLNQLTSEQIRLEGEALTTSKELAAATTEQSVATLAAQAAAEKLKTSTVNLDTGTEELIASLGDEIEKLGLNEKALFLLSQERKIGETATVAQRVEVEALSIALFDEQVQIEATEQAKKDAKEAQTLINSLNDEIAALERTERANFLLSAERGLGATATDLMRQEVVDLAGALFDERTEIELTKTADKEAADAAVQNSKDVKREGEKAAKALAKQWGETRDKFAGFFVDMFENGSSAFTALFDSFKKMVLNMVAQWAASGIMKLLGLGGGGPTAAGGVSLLGGGGGIPSGAGIVSGVASAAVAAGEFIGGVAGTAVGTGSAIIGPPTAAAAAGAGLGGNIAAFATNPIVLGVLAAAALATLLDESGTFSHNAGMLTADLAAVDASRKFDIEAFASGAQFTGFNRRSTMGEAETIIDAFAQLDFGLTQAALAVGITPNLNAGSFVGLDEKGQGSGAFFGSAFEDDGDSGQSIESQLDSYASQWIRAVGNQAGVDAAGIDSIIGGGDAVGILGRAQDVAGIDGSFRHGLDRVPRDGFIAELHERERVLTAAQADAQDADTQQSRAEGSGFFSMIFNLTATIIDLFNIFDKWDGQGLPPTRIDPDT